MSRRSTKRTAKRRQRARGAAGEPTAWHVLDGVDVDEPTHTVTAALNGLAEGERIRDKVVAIVVDDILPVLHLVHATGADTTQLARDFVTMFRTVADRLEAAVERGSAGRD